jgi:hypothetical protein
MRHQRNNKKAIRNVEALREQETARLTLLLPQKKWAKI